MGGLRPVAELMTINFSLVAMDQIVNNAAKIHAMFGSQARVPLVIRALLLYTKGNPGTACLPGDPACDGGVAAGGGAPVLASRCRGTPAFRGDAAD